MQQIPEFHKFRYEKGNLYRNYSSQFKDFLKIWIWIDGPEKILKQVLIWEPELKINLYVVHPCQACAYIYKNEKIQKIIQQYFANLD
ncbi:hypothetical protein PFZ79_002803 [Enterococcus hirae]|nr:hypothetical protein [Enterococcus hirae]